jgi:ferritin-like metal-binding protein YciE
MKLDSLTDPLIDGLQEIDDVERQLLKALPKMSKAVFSEELRDAFSLHAEQTRSQLKRLEDMLKKLHSKPTSKRCDGMRGIIAEAEALLAQAPQADPAVFDAALIAAAQRAEHYEIAAYGTLRTYAQTLGATEAVKLLQLTLDEEGETDRKLTELAQSTVNLDAAEADQELQRGAAGQMEETEETDSEQLSRSRGK